MFALSSPGPVGDAEALRALRTVGDDIARFHQFMRKKVLRLKDTTDPGLAALRTTCRTLVLVGGGGTTLDDDEPPTSRKPTTCRRPEGASRRVSATYALRG